VINKQLHPPLIRTLSRLQSVFWRRRLLHGLVRALWLALLVPTITMIGYLWWGWQVRWDLWVSVMVLVGFLTLLWSLRPISLKMMVHRLDKLLKLRAQLITAFEASEQQAQAENLIVGQLLQNTVDLSVKLRRQINLIDRNFWLEMHTLVGIAAVLGALLIFDALTPRIPEAAIVDLPALGQEPKADEVVPPDPELQPPPSLQEQLQQLSQAQLQAALEALAEALRDQAVTRAAAEALDRGDIGEAAQELRRLADQLGELSEDAQQGLGEALQEAADNIGEEVPGLTQPLQSGSTALATDNLPGAGQALEELAETLEMIDEVMQEGQPESEGEASSGEGETEGEGGGNASGEGAGDGAGDGPGGEGDDPLGEEEERLPIDGQPLEIESDEELDDRVLQPAELDAEAGDERTSDSPFARQALNATGDDLGPDPLTYPWEKREIIRQYFTP
jgi:hypothetical protein